MAEAPPTHHGSVGINNNTRKGGFHKQQEEKKEFGNVKRLPPNSFAIMVHRLYADRVRNAMSYCEDCWTTLVGNGTSSTTKKCPIQENGSREATTCRVVPTTEVSGVRKSRRGYALLVLENCQLSTLQELPPLARQNISWGATLSHEWSIFYKKENQLHVLASHLWNHLKSNEVRFDATQHTLRVDTHPKEENGPICRALQMKAAATLCNGQKDLNSGPVPQKENINSFEGPIAMTRSASNCTHVFTVLYMMESNTHLWGITNRDQHQSVSLNHQAAVEICVQPTHPNTGLDLSLDNNNETAQHEEPGHVPVSRAYYKLSQVWHEILWHQVSFGKNNNVFGLDLGASPGGWTQVLRHLVKLPHVISVDPGCLAKRVVSDHGVHHAVADLASDETAAAIQQHHGGNSNNTARKCCMLVCDACIDSYLVLNKILDLLKKLSHKPLWTCPAAFVITLKLPYKTLPSLERNLQKVKQAIPTQLRSIAQQMYPNNTVNVRYQICHLMANSDSERTLVVVFE